MSKVSIIVPVYNEEEAIKIFYDKITEVSAKMEADFEYIFVNDGSKDKTLELMRELAKKDSRVQYISFSRNFGKEAAMYAGLEASLKTNCDAAIIMDVDLQDPPSLFDEMNKEFVNIINISEVTPAFKDAFNGVAELIGASSVVNYLVRRFYHIDKNDKENIVIKALNVMVENMQQGINNFAEMDAVVFNGLSVKRRI